MIFTPQIAKLLIKEIMDKTQLREIIRINSHGLDNINIDSVTNEIFAGINSELTVPEILSYAVLVIRPKIEKEPSYSYLAARIFNEIIENEVKTLNGISTFKKYLKFGIKVKRINPELLEQFDISQIEAAIKTDRTKLFNILGIQTLYDRYLLHDKGVRFETVQYFFMRVAMGIALNEKPAERTMYAISFYDLLSRHYFMSSTPTLFNSGTLHSQMSSCYLSTVEDDLKSIFKLYSDNAQLSKWAGGLGNDWTPVRATSAHISGTNGESQGVIPFLKVNNDTLVAVNQGGKRKGAGCAYLETWHMDILDFLELRKNTGDERRRTHDMNTSNWIPDLFMERVQENGKWTLFTPNEVPELHDLYGKKFKDKYEKYEKLAEEGKILSRTIDALDLWKKMLSMIFETGHPWLCFKEPSNLRSPQQHVGVVHSSNLCFTGNTKVLLEDGKIQTIKELYETTKSGKEFRIPSALRHRKRLEYNEYEWSGFETETKRHEAAVGKYSGKNKVIEVTLENGGKFRCTPEHQLSEHGLEYMEAKDSLNRFMHTFENTPIKVIKIEDKDIEDTYDLTAPDYGNFFIQAGDRFVLVHNCTEITLNTSKEETAVCNLGSVNLPKHLYIDPITRKIRIDLDLLENTVNTAVRMLDNVIDLNFYPIPEAETANKRHRPVGLGLMGFQDCLYMKNYSYASEAAVKFSDYSMEAISYFAIQASANLAAERGKYETFEGSLWDKGILPIDSIRLLAENRSEENLTMTNTSSGDFDWDSLRKRILAKGMRNSNVLAIAPTATISNIIGVTQSIEPSYKNLFVKSNLSGEYIIANNYLINSLKELGIWDEQMIDDLKYYDGSVLEIPRIPEHIKEIFQTAFEIDSSWLIECAARRQKWIDQAQSLNLYCAIPSGVYLSDMYMYAWKSGLKTTYYLRCMGATQIEKSTIDINKRGLQPRWMKNKSSSGDVVIKHNLGNDLPSIQPQEKNYSGPVKISNPDEGDCDACQ